MVLTAYIELSPVIGLVCHRRQQICGFAGPGRADQTSADLTPASRRQDRTTSPSAVTSLVDTHFRSLTGKPALRFIARKMPPRPPHPVPTSVTIAKRPSC